MAKTALITGGSSGLGYELARSLGSRGYHLIILARNMKKIDKVISQLKDEKYNAIGFQCDITREDRLKEVVSEIKKTCDRIDFLVLNAGVVTPKLFQDFKNTTELRHDLEINLWGTILSAHIFLSMVKPGAHILMISSAFGLMGPAVYSVYAASKAGLINFGESLRRELLCKNISVHVACPADINTPQLHEEHKRLPKWFKQSDPRKAMSAHKAAERILKKCFKNVFLIIISFEIFILIILNKILPRKLSIFFMDKLFPLPKQ